MAVHALHVNGGGGLGDLIYNYFCKDKWRLIAPIKEKYPDILIAGILTCHATPAPELIELNPNIDVLVTHKWYAPGHPKEKMWQDIVKSEDIKKFAKREEITPGEQKIYLSNKEKAIYKKISKKPYVLIHPFAGLPHRGCMKHPVTGRYMCFPDYMYIELAKELNKRGYRVVIVGYSESAKGGAPRERDDILEIDEPPGIVNLINKAPLRLSVKLARGARGFVGSHSSMLAAAWTNSVPSVFFYPNVDNHGSPRSIKQHGGETGTWQLDRPYHHCYELAPEEFQKLDILKVADQLEHNIDIKTKPKG